MKLKTNNVKLTVKYLFDKFNQSEYYNNRKDEKEYRLNHSVRVAAIGEELAKKEGLNEEALVIGCLLHDISYSTGNIGNYADHGRISAKMARDFLNTLDLNRQLVEEILFGIAIHVDDMADFAGERTTLALSISDCDNIDRFDTYRFYDFLKHSNLDTMTLDQQIEYSKKVLDKLLKLYHIETATETARIFWQDRITYQINFFQRLLLQLETSIITE